jgi:hypothetical protein
MSKHFDGTKEKNRRESTSYQRDSNDSHKRVGIVQTESGSDEHDEIGSNQSNRSRQNLLSRVQSVFVEGEVSPGKILESLNLIKEAHLAYVHAHRQRLEARLDENKESETEFIQACDLLEQQINNLINKPDSENNP